MEEKVTKSHDITPVQQMLSSCIGSMITSVVVTPLDVVKVRLQSHQKAIASNNKCFLYCNGYIEDLCCQLHAGKEFRIGQAWPKAPLNSTFGTLVNIGKSEGITTLWSGLPTTLAMAVPATVVYFTLYDQMRLAFTTLCQTPQLPLWAPVVSGATARFVCVSLISPLEMVRTKMQSTKLSYREISAALRNLIRSNGLHSLWRGVGPTYWRDIPFSAIYWTNYELFKRRFNQETPSWWFSFFAGATSGTIAAVATLPFDVVKTHLQVELGDVQQLANRSRKSTFPMLKALYKKGGYKALFVGIVPRVVKIAPACAIMISTYEHGKQYFRKRNESKYEGQK